MENYVSLYDYAGRALGKDVGGKVAQAANQKGIPLKTRSVENPVYTGEVRLYPREFLDEYFNKPEIVEPTLGDIQDYDDLPF